MKIPKITQKMLDAARKAGACKINYKPGQPITDLTWLDALWVEDNLPRIVTRLKLSVPLWALASDGYGFGDGFGYGFGFGDGSGYGFGDGFGFGSMYTKLFKETK